MTIRRRVTLAAAAVLVAIPAIAHAQAPGRQPTGPTPKQPPAQQGKKQPGAGAQTNTPPQPPKPVEPPAPAPPEFNYAMLRIDELEAQLAQRIASQRTNDALTALGAAADINFRLAAVSLLRAGVAKGVDGALAILYGHTLADHADDAQKLFDSAVEKIKGSGAGPALLPGVAASAQPTGPLPRGAITEAIQKFNAEADLAYGMVRDATDREIESYLQRVLAPLAVLATSLGTPSPQDTWLMVTARQSAEPAPNRALTDKDLDALARRIQTSTLSSATKNEMLYSVDRMKRGWANAELRPQLVGMYEPLHQAIDIADALASAAWLGETALGDLKRQIEIGVLLVNDRRLQNTAVERFDAMARGLGLVRQIGELEKLQAPVDSLRSLYLAAHQLAAKKADARTASRLIEYLEQLTALMLESRSMKVEQLPLELRRTAQALQKEHQQSELELLKKLPELQATPAALEDAAWAEALKQLRDRIELTRRVTAVHEWTDRLLKYKPKNATRLGITLRAIAGNVMLTTKRQVASGQLRALERQMRTFDPIPREEVLRSPSDHTKALVGDSLPLLTDQLDRLRSEWATHWANGADPAETVEKLRKLSRLVEAIHSAAVLANADEVVERLNRWAAWQGRVEALRPLLKTMSERIAAAAKLAGSADWATLETTITQVQHEAPLALLVARLDATLGPQLTGLHDGLAGCLSQGLYVPRAASFGAPQRQELALVSAYLLEAAHANLNENPTQLDAVLTYAGYQARNVLDSLDGKARPKPAAPTDKPAAPPRP